MSLGLLYEFPEFALDLISILLLRDPRKVFGQLPRLRKIVFVRFILTHFICPISGVMTVASGLRLIQVGHHSFLEGWLFWMVPLAAIFVCKGLLHHNSYARALFYAFTCKNTEVDSVYIRRMIYSPFDVALNLMELPAYLFIFFTNYCKPTWPVPWPGVFQKAGTLSPNSSLIGVAIFVLVFLCVIPLLSWAVWMWSVCRGGHVLK